VGDKARVAPPPGPDYLRLPALAISRWAENTDRLILLASSVSVHSRPGVNSTSVSNSAGHRRCGDGHYLLPPPSRRQVNAWPTQGLAGAFELQTWSLG